jgi:hypothetical protein
MKRVFGLAMLGFALALPAAFSADGITPGNWKMVVPAPTANVERTELLVKLEAKDGKTTATLVAPAPSEKVELVSFAMTGDRVRIVAKAPVHVVFQGRLTKDGKKIMGVTDDGNTLRAAYMVPTDMTKIEANDKTRKLGIDQLDKITQLANAASALTGKVRQTKDNDEKVKLQIEADAANRKADAEIPILYKEIIAKHPKTFAAGGAALALLRRKGFEPTPMELKTWAELASQSANEFGPIWTAEVNTQIAMALMTRKHEPLAVEFATKAEKALDETCSMELQVKVLQTLSRLVNDTGNRAVAPNVSARLAKLEETLDNEYVVKVPPFKGQKYAGRKGQSDRAVVMELFTGAQCNPCIAADVAFDVLGKTYKPTELVLIEYHLHIPGPDPMTNAATEARAKHYKANSTPSTFFNGKPKAGGGGAMAAAEKKYATYRAIIDPLLEEPAACKIKATARQVGDKVQIQTNVADLEKPGKDAKLHVLLVEETIRFVGSNKIRFHHQVVRAMPGGAAGVSVMNPAQSVNQEVDLGNLRKQLVGYLDHYEETMRTFPQVSRPLDFHGLRVIAFVQDDSTNEIMQAVQVDVVQ